MTDKARFAAPVVYLTRGGLPETPTELANRAVMPG